MQRDLHLAKTALREEVWGRMEASRGDVLCAYPGSCVGKIPHFVGCTDAAMRLSDTPEFKSASTIKVNPSLAQHHLRLLILKAGKHLISTIPIEGEIDYSDPYKSVTFLHVDPGKMPFLEIHKAVSKKGMQLYGVVCTPEELPEVDLVVSGVTVVGDNGVRLGKGKGYAEIEWEMLRGAGKVSQGTHSATTCHDVQVVAGLQVADLVAPHDLPVDIIATPQQLLRVQNPLPKP